jgi:hypothetical protein
MGYVMFESKALSYFLSIYEGGIDGEGLDWYFLYVLGANQKSIAGIVDSIVVLNPLNSQKKFGNELNRYFPRSLKSRSWNSEEKGFSEWEQANLFEICKLPPKPRDLYFGQSLIPEWLKVVFRPLYLPLLVKR